MKIRRDAIFLIIFHYIALQTSEKCYTILMLGSKTT